MADEVLNERGMTELHLAAYHGELDWVQNCLGGGLDIHARDREGYTPLHWVVDMGMVDGDREEIVAELLQAGADINAKTFSGNSVLAIARNTGNQNIVRQLIKAGARDEIKVKE